MTTLLAAFLDKEYPPAHSFVDGFLASALPKAGNVRTVLFTSRGSEPARVRRYGRAISLNALPRRRGAGRLALFFVAALWIIRLRVRCSKRRRRLVVLVRNDPSMLAGAAAVRSRRSGLWYQNSFPHEAGNGLKQIIARALLKVSLPHVEYALTVSELGRQRLQAISPRTNTFVVPLCPEDGLVALPRPVDRDDTRRLRVIYIGTHAAERQLHRVLAACAGLHEHRVPMEFAFVGGTQSEIEALRDDPKVRTMEAAGALQFYGKMERASVWNLLLSSDIGLSLIPVNELYIEASPTKLAEYLAAGLAVVASEGIPAQVEMVAASQAGLTVRFEERAMQEVLQRLAEDRYRIRELQANARRFASSFTYSRFVEPIRSALMGNVR